MNVFARFSLVLAMTLACTQCYRVGPPGGRVDPYRAPQRQPVSSGGSSGSNYSKLMREVNLKSEMVRSGSHGRRVVRPMRPRYITIHATENYTADAHQHAIALRNGALRSPKTKHGNRIGYLIWHFTVDSHEAIQHMPTNEQGEHADFHGPGNRLSIGIEMCENRDGSRAATVERTAKLTAILMKKNRIPLANVVPHYHWPRRGKHPANKPCPHFMMEHGRPGRAWRAFLGRVNYYYRSL